ncbi:hypothetical protein KC929_02630 [Patescibacteria group bacterium]|nr:hypothetical protein [Patescibacteria group bacterium]
MEEGMHFNLESSGGGHIEKLKDLYTITLRKDNEPSIRQCLEKIFQELEPSDASIPSRLKGMIQTVLCGDTERPQGALAVFMREKGDDVQIYVQIINGRGYEPNQQLILDTVKATGFPFE